MCGGVVVIGMITSGSGKSMLGALVGEKVGAEIGSLVGWWNGTGVGSLDGKGVRPE